MAIIDSFDSTPNTNMLDILGSSGYSLKTAIADVLDNSITAKAKNIYINFFYDEEDSYIQIIDDGKGMSFQKMKEASIIGFKSVDESRDLDDLGRFSAGLNAASMSMANKLTIQSKQTEINTFVLDFAKMKNKGWKTDIIETEEVYIKTETGTAIIWTRLKELATANTRKEFFDKIAIVEEHLSHVFNDYIENGLKIYINNNLVKGWDPFLKKNPKTTITGNNTFSYNGYPITITMYILPTYNNLNPQEQKYMEGYGLEEQQGFYIYRNNRLIKEGGWLELEGLSMSNKYNYARIRVDVTNQLDDVFKPNFMKSEIFIPNDLVEYFKKIARKARKESRENYNYMKAPTISRNIKKSVKTPVWNIKHSSDGLILAVNDEHPIIKSICEKLSEQDKKRLFSLISKNIPVGEITRTGVSVRQNDYKNIIEEIEDMYNKLVETGLSSAEIMKKMSTCEPFCLSDDYTSELIDFFDKKGLLG